MGPTFSTSDNITTNEVLIIASFQWCAIHERSPVCQDLRTCMTPLARRIAVTATYFKNTAASES